MTSSRQRTRTQARRADRHLRHVEADDETALGVQPPQFTPLTEEREIQAVAALTVLFHDALAARRKKNDPAPNPRTRRRAA